MSSSSPLSFSKNNPNQHFSFMTDRTNNSSIKNIAARNISSALSLQRSRARNTREDKLSKKRLASKIEDEEIEAIKEHEAYVDFQLEQEEIRQLEEEYEEQQNFEKRLLLTGKSCLENQNNNKNKNDPENGGDDNTSDCGAECGGDDDEVDLQLDDGESRLFSHLQQSKYKNNQNNSKINHLHHNNNSNPQQQNDDDDAAQQYYHEQQQEEYDNEYFLEDPEELYQYHLMMQQYNQYQQELQQQQGNTNNNMNNNNCSSNSNNYYTEADHQKFRKFREEVETSCAKMTRVHQEDSSCYSEDTTKHVSFCLPSNNSENENHYNNNYYQNNNYYYSSGGGDDDGNFMMSKNTGSKGNGNLRYTDLGYDKNGEKVVAIFKDMTNNNPNSASYVAGNMFCAQD